VNILDKAEELERLLAKNDQPELMQFLHSIVPNFAANRQVIMLAPDNGKAKGIAASASLS
jgi:hypothetical protein